MSDVLKPYEHGGNIHSAATDQHLSTKEILDFSANINPFGAPEWLRSCISRNLDSILHYPDPCGEKLRACISDTFGIEQLQIIVANGSTELLYQLPSVLKIKRAVIPVPCYIDYLKVMELSGIEVKEIVLQEKNGFQVAIDELDKTLEKDDLLILGTPNNPTGTLVEAAEIIALATKHSESLFLVDEAFLDFAENGKSIAARAENILSLHSLTKFYAIPGLRLGYGVFPQKIASQLRSVMPPWSVNSLALEVGIRALADTEYSLKSIQYCRKCKDVLTKALAHFPDLTVYPSAANFLLCKLPSGEFVQKIKKGLLHHKILIRECANYKTLNSCYFRIAVRTEKENLIFIEALSSLLPVVNRQRKVVPKKTPAIMFQGTSSNAGKSVLTAALCRILIQDGVRVAPFKAQNMSLNSFVTHDGLEMGRAQVVQAQAARLDPSVLMNPVLLKPNSDTGSQVIVRGKSVGNMRVLEYVKYKKKELMEEVCTCYDELAANYQAIILEGAGSPGEVNLKKDDIVNMRMARYAESPVILVGDIDRGGVYASFVGTMEVLNSWERDLVAGFLVNRFRGDARLLQDAHDYVKGHTGKDVLGVIPYLKNHGIPEEDSVSFNEGLFSQERPEHDHIEIAVINLPHISNFTDIEPFIAESDVHLRIVSSVKELGSPDIVILPGSKNVIADLKALKKSGLVAAIERCSREGSEIVGICGGYQMLGQVIRDPNHIESSELEMNGLGLIQMQTELASEKILQRKNGTHIPSGQPVCGYEIHHGMTKTSATPLFEYDDQSQCGVLSDTQDIWGSYLHGMFDSDLFRRWLINKRRVKKGLEAYTGVTAIYNLEPAFERLAADVRKGLDMDRVYQLLGL